MRWHATYEAIYCVAIDGGYTDQAALTAAFMQARWGFETTVTAQAHFGTCLERRAGAVRIREAALAFVAAFDGEIAGEFTDVAFGQAPWRIDHVSGRSSRVTKRHIGPMRNIAIMLAILVGACAAAKLLGAGDELAGRIAIAGVFLFTAVGHFVRPDDMLEMMPPVVPARKALVILSGAFEVALAAGLALPQTCRDAGIVATAFLLLVTPLNVYAALKRVSFGGHGAGPRYLLVRLPLQALLIAWIWWFVLCGR